jgi:DNA polymerase Ligase (LigD)
LPDPPRFVILEHRWAGIHWDVMLERDGALRTWAIDSPLASGETFAARPLPDHRLAYLDYEGPVSGDRGEVRRVGRGVYRIQEWSDERIVVTLAGSQPSGELMLSRVGGAWFLRFEPPGNVD